MNELDSAFLILHRDSFLWLVGTVGAVMGSVAFRLHSMLARLLRGSDELVLKHRHADDHGFGTVELRENAAHLLRVAKSNARLAHWQAAQLTGKEPPPLDLD